MAKQFLEGQKLLQANVSRSQEQCTCCFRSKLAKHIQAREVFLGTTQGWPGLWVINSISENCLGRSGQGSNGPWQAQSLFFIVESQGFHEEV